jgi:Uma2 family endonuclease
VTSDRRSLIEALYRVPENGKAEIVRGEIVLMGPSGHLPSRAAGAIYRSLFSYERQTARGVATGSNLAFLVTLPDRWSFSPDAGFFVGPTTGMRFLEGAPVFAVEVRSENDHGPAVEQAMAEKRAEYFAAGTEVVWDVDLNSRDIVRAYRAGEAAPAICRRGQVAEVEPALPGWRMAVGELFS